MLMMITITIILLVFNCTKNHDIVCFWWRVSTSLIWHFAAVREDRTPGGKHKNTNFSLNARIKSEPAAKLARTSSSSSSSSDLVDAPPAIKTPTRTFPPFIKELLRHEPQLELYSQECAGCQLEDMGQKTLAHVTQRAEAQIKRNLEWFRCLPLLHEISENDKRLLSKSAWIELMLVNLTKQSLQLDDKVGLCQGQVLDFSTAQLTGIGDIMHRVIQLTAKFKELNLDDAEFVCLKVIILLNPGKKPYGRIVVISLSSACISLGVRESHVFAVFFQYDWQENVLLPFEGKRIQNTLESSLKDIW